MPTDLHSGPPSVTESITAYRKRIFNEIPQLPQRQDSLDSQLADLRSVANRLGMYDAADLIGDIQEGNRP